MSALALIFVLIWVSLVLLLWFGAAWFQDFLYSEPAGQLYWRAPVAGAILVLWMYYWCSLDFRNPGRYPALYDFSATERKRFDEFWVVRDKQKVQYKLSSASKSNLPGRAEYKEAQFPYRTWTGSESIIVMEDGQEVRFEAERDRDNNFKRAAGRDLRYLDAHGRVMSEGTVGQVFVFRRSLFFTYAFLNMGLLSMWFLCLWLLIRFQWSHALGLAAVFWMGSILLLMPMLLARAEETAQQHSPTQAHGWQPVGFQVSSGVRACPAAGRFS